jgi:hypothetical protein
MSPPSSRLTKSQARNHLEAGGKQSNRLAEISVYVGNRRKMEDRKSVPFGMQRSKANDKYIIVPSTLISLI